MSRQALGRLVRGLLPAGVLGLSAALAPCAEAAPGQPAGADVAARLSAIRAAVSVAVLDMPVADADAVEGVQPGSVQKVWWGNGGWGRRWGWGNGGWRGGWRNGGWGNGGWRNGGWGNWHPWVNF